MNWQGIRPIVAAALITTASTASAQSTTPTDAKVQDLIRAAAERAGVPNLSVPAAPQAATGGDRPTVSLTLDDAIKLALDRNLDIAVQRLNPETFDYSIANIQAFYKPALVSTLSTNSNTNPNTSTISGGSNV